MKLNIITATYLKQSTVAAKELPSDKRYAVTANTVLEVAKASAAPNGHLRVTLETPLGGFQTWLVFADHVDCPQFNRPIILDVPYYSQRDNKVDWWKTCNSSSNAMAAEFLKPGCVDGSDDVYYSKYLVPEGDSTDHDAQTRALAKLGIKSEFRYDLDYDDLDEQLEKGKPVVIGVLHRGTIAAPTGGHVLVVVGRYDKGYICNDPWGKGFNYDSHNGRRVEYPYESLNARWLVNTPKSGWGRIFD